MYLLYAINILISRNRRMFGALIGTLQGFQKDSKTKKEKVCIPIPVMLFKSFEYLCDWIIIFFTKIIYTFLIEIPLQEEQRMAIEQKLDEKAQQERENVIKERNNLFEKRKRQQIKLRRIEQKMEIVGIVRYLTIEFCIVFWISHRFVYIFNIKTLTRKDKIRFLVNFIFPDEIKIFGWVSSHQAIWWQFKGVNFVWSK